MQESEKINKYLDLAWELKKLWNKKLMEIPVLDVLYSRNTWKYSQHTDDFN